MTPGQKENLIKKAKHAINFRNVMTSAFIGVMMWISNGMLSSFTEIKEKFNSDHRSVIMLVPAVRILQRSDSLKTFQLIDMKNDLEQLKEGQKDGKADMDKIEQLMIRLIQQTK